MTATTYNLTIEQGIPFEQEFLVKNPNGSVKDLTGFSGRMQFRLQYSSPTPALSATSANGKIVINTIDSICKIVLTEADTTALIYNKYVYDVELLDASNKPLRLIEGVVTVTPEVTH